MSNPNSNEQSDQTDVVALIAALTTSVGTRRLEAARALGKSRDPRAVETLITAFKEVRGAPGSGLEYSEIVLALGRIGDARAVEALIAFLHYEHPLTGYKDPLKRRYAADGLGEARDPRAVEPLFLALDEYQEPEVRRAAARALGRIGDVRAVEALFARLQSEYPTVRKLGVIGLGEIRDARVVEPLIATLHDQDDEVRAEAAEALGHSGDARAVLPLLEALDDEFWVYVGEGKSYVVREEAQRALKAIGEPAVEALIAMLQSPDAIRRRRAARFLGKMGDQRTVAPLTAALNDPDSNVRLGAENSLNELRQPR